jgi:hypothetical protein
MNQIPFPGASQRIHGVKFKGSNTTVPEAPEEGSGGFEAAGTVVDEIHLDPLRSFHQQQVSKPAPDFIVPNGERFHVDMIGSVEDGIAHGSVGRVSIGEERHLVSSRQGAPTDPLDLGNLAAKNPRWAELLTKPRKD